MKYEFSEIENKWQKKWLENKTFAATTGDPRPKCYPMIEFPYPSGDGLHVGHPRPYTALDIVARKRRMQGYNVLFPIGFDAFGLPTENYAIKNHMHPRDVTKRNVERFTQQLQMLGYSFDWDRCVVTSDPTTINGPSGYSSRCSSTIWPTRHLSGNWCTLQDRSRQRGGRKRRCERCGGEVVNKQKSQWMLEYQVAQRC